MEIRKIIFDSNFLVDIFRFKIDFEEMFFLATKKAKLVIPRFVIEELRRINSPFSKLALELIKKKNFKVVETKEKGDKGFFELIDKYTVVATNDSKLRKKLKKLGVKTIYLRGLSKLEMS